MPDQVAPPAVLSVPEVQPAHYARNLIEQVVCEFRFPTLFELEGDQPPLAFAKALRKEYPVHARHQQVKLNPQGIEKVAPGHVFRSKNSRWTITLRASSLSIETSQYDSFAEFKDRIGRALVAAVDVIDTDFFTRIGLRYINSVPFNLQEIGEWVNPELVAPLTRGIYGDVTEHSLRVGGTTKIGTFAFHHGVGVAQTSERKYVLDFDFAQEDVEVSNAMSVVQELHDLEFAMFSWSLGPKATAHLGPSDLRR